MFTSFNNVNQKRNNHIKNQFKIKEKTITNLCYDYTFS